ncbi:AMIN-like domain-containing (lipo)protein [Kribbella sp. GL6]|uniref:AMIN-like domain-containing (lipo)protein n=1 Tax=Kribbella sp. GL6 TaxID=3419765 RepID=UPI003CFEB777
MNIHRTTRTTVLAALAVLAIPAAAFAAPAVAGSSTTLAPMSTTAPCPRGWGSLPKSDSRMVQSPITDVRAGRHACFDRIVVDLHGRAAGYDVRYVANVRQEGSGFVVPLRGGAKLQVVVRAPAYAPLKVPNVNGYSALRQVAFAGSFEGQTTLGVGVRARLPFRVFTLAGPGSNTRLVVDVAHHW